MTNAGSRIRTLLSWALGVVAGCLVACSIGRADDPLLSVGRLFGAKEFDAEPLPARRWNKRTPTYFTLEKSTAGSDLVRNDPATGKTETLLKDLYFANGVTLSANEDFVLVNETYRYRITRYWLSGEKAGTHDVFIDNLPGLAGLRLIGGALSAAA